MAIPRFYGAVLVSLMVLCTGFASSALASEKVRIAFIDPLSGPFANTGEIGLRHAVYLADWINANGGVLGRELEVVPMDNKGNPQESLAMLRKAADAGIPFVMQGLGSHVASALMGGVAKHNRRNPDQRILFLDYGNQNPALVNEQCSFWRFAFEANGDMKLDLITDYIADNDSIDSVYLINQDYGFGHLFAAAAKRQLARKAPDVDVAGEVFHPIGRVKDFSPYISQIRASGADAVITGNWGNDLALLIKAGADAGLDVRYFTQAAAGPGTPSAVGADGEDEVFLSADYYSDLPTEDAATADFRELIDGFESRHPDTDWYFLRMVQMYRMLTRAMEQSGSTDPLAVARAMEGMTLDTVFGPVTMRADNHQLLQPLYLSRFTEDATTTLEGTGMGFVRVMKAPAARTRLPTSCEMQRPID